MYHNEDTSLQHMIEGLERGSSENTVPLAAQTSLPGTGSESDRMSVPMGHDPYFSKAWTGGDPIWSILPSYQMYRGSIQRSLSIPDQDHSEHPPTYESSAPGSMTSGASGSVNEPTGTPVTSLWGDHAPGPSSSGNSGDFILADENTNFWQETILDNAHKLKNLTNTDNEVSNAVEFEIFFTEEVCVKGKTPTYINPSLFEYKEGDYLNGYILIKNHSDEPIPFEMLYMIFEGKISVRNTRNAGDASPKIVNKFLEMFDFSASWNSANIQRLVGADGDCENNEKFDPLDNSCCCFGKEKTMFPGVLYKRFFTFKIPKNLLDSECNEHNLQMHVEMPPTLGEYDVTSKTPGNSNIKDFSMLGTSISYGVTVRFVGRKSKYKVKLGTFPEDDQVLVNSKGDEYMILKEDISEIRILQQSKEFSEAKILEFRILHNNLISRIKEKIETGNRLIKLIRENDNCSAYDLSQEISKKELEFAKLKQAYVRKIDAVSSGRTIEPESIEMVTPFTKKTFTGGHKALGSIKLSTPRKRYVIDYIPPIKFRERPIDEHAEKSWKFDIPLDITYIFPDNAERSSKVPLDVKQITTEFVVTTVRSDKYAFPIEFGHELVYNKLVDNNTFFDKDSFTNNVVLPMKDNVLELRRIHSELGTTNFSLERQFVQDITSLAYAKEKSLNLMLDDTIIESRDASQMFFSGTSKATVLPWKPNGDGRSYSNQINLKVDLTTMMLKEEEGKKQSSAKAYDKYCLVPKFQSCFMGRWYQVRIKVSLSNNKFIYIKVPVTVAKN